MEGSRVLLIPVSSFRNYSFQRSGMVPDSGPFGSLDGPFPTLIKQIASD